MCGNEKKGGMEIALESSREQLTAGLAPGRDYIDADGEIDETCL